MAATFSKPVLLLFTSVFLHVSVLFAQQNGGFEEWMSSGSPPPFDWEFPVGWTTNNATTEFTSAGVNPSDDAHSGSLAAHLRTVNVFGTLEGAELFLGDCALSFPTYSVLGYTCGEPLAMKPQLVRFYYKLEVGAPFENAFVQVLIKRPSGGQFPDTVDLFLVGLGETDQYLEAEIDISSADVNPATDSIVIGFVSNHESAVGINNLFVDDVSIEFTTAIHEVSSSVLFNVYPNPVQSGDDLHIRFPDNIVLGDIQILNPFGCYRSKAHFNMSENVMQLSTSGLSPGLYYIISGNESVSRFAVFD